MSERVRVHRTGVWSATGWATLSFAGFAAALSLIVSGASVGYQHYLPLVQLWSKPLAVGVLLVQALVSLVVLRDGARQLLDRATTLLPGWRLPALIVLSVGSSAIVGRDLPRFVGELLLSSIIQVVSLATTVLAVRAIPSDALQRLRIRVDRVLGHDGEYGDSIPPQLDRFALVIAVSVMAVCALLAVVVYDRHPHIADEVAYLFQARTFASGRVTLPNPPVPGAFELYLLESGPRGWFSPVPPGWSAALVPGVLIGAPWLVNPVLTGVNVLLAYLALQPLYGRRTARLSTLLFAASPWNLFLGMSYMPHAFTLCCALAATLGVIAARRTGLTRWAVGGGFALGALASVRQLDALVMAGVLGLWSIGVGGRRLRASGTIALVLGSLFATIPLLMFNRYFTGKASVFPMMAYVDRLFGKGANDYGFGRNRGMGWALDPNPGHGPVDGIINATLNTSATQVELFGWSVGSLLLAYAFVLRGHLRTADRLMLGTITAVWLAYFFNYFSGGPDFGARYWFLMIVPLCALTARGALTLEANALTSGEGSAAGRGDTRMLAGTVLLTVGALLTFVPWRSVDKYRDYRGMRKDIVALVQSRQIERGLVLVAGREFPDFASAATYNPLDLQAPVPVYARRTTPANDSAVIAAFADRNVWFVDGPSVSGTGFVIRDGPLSTSAALARLTSAPVPP
ncbi:MAG: hypothetical protein ABMA00_03755 [Gemmatimonas sp.]